MNLSIPESALELGVSETRLRRTLSQISVPAAIEFRNTRTGVRKTTVLSEQAIALLRAHFQAPLPCVSDASSHHASEACSFEEAEAPVEHSLALPERREDSEAEAPLPAASVPLAQFHALLYQHNVLREELARVSDYLEGCDRLLGEMVKTIAALEERTRQLPPSPAFARRGFNPLSEALRSVSAGVQNALFARGVSQTPGLKPNEVYYANVLGGAAGSR